MKAITAKFGVVLVCGAGAALAAGAMMTSSSQSESSAPASSDVRSNEARVERALAPVMAAPAAQSATASDKPVLAGAPDGCAFEKGAIAAYSLHGKDTASIDALGFGIQGDAEAVEIESKYSATLRTEVLEVSDDGALVLGALDEFRSTAVREDARVRAPFLFRVGSDCNLLGFAHGASLHEGYARIQQALLHDLTYQVPTGNISTFYEGQDTLGNVAGKVALRDGTVEKRITSLEPWSAGMGSLSGVDSAISVITPADAKVGGWFARVAFTGHYTGTGITATRMLDAKREDAAGENSLVGASRQEKDYVWADLLHRTIPLDEGAAVSRRELKQRDAVRDKSVDTILDRLVERVDNKAGIQQTWPELRTYLEARPEMVQVVADKIIRDEIPAQATMGAFIALGNTRNPEAKQALESIVHDPSIASFDRVRAMFSLVDRADVGDAFALELARLAASLTDDSKSKAEHLTARHALLALGMMSGRKPNREDIKKIAVAAVEDALAKAPNAIIASPAYGALMNIGDPALLSLIEDIPDHPDFSTREVAAIAMRRMPPSETAEFTRRWLVKEKDWRVKITLYHSLELQTFAAQEMTSREVIELAIADLEKRPGAITRKALVRLLGRATLEMAPEDPLRKRIEGEFAAMIPFEVENRTGLYRIIAPHVDPATLRLALTGQLDRGNDPTRPTQPSPGPTAGIDDAETPSLSSAVSGQIRSAK